MINKNETYITEITGYSSEGEGIGRIDDFVVFIPGVILGETVKVLIVKVLKTYAYGKVIEIVKPSPERLEPLCPYFPRCGGCSLWHMTYQEELEFKRKKVEDTIRKIGGISATVEKTVPSPLVTEYRNKAQYPVSPEGIGFYASRSHKVIDLDNCLIQNNVNQRIIGCVRRFMDEYGISPYNEENHTGIIRNVFIRTAHYSGEILVCIVTKSKELPHKDALVEMLTEINGMTSIILNHNPDKTNVVLGKKNTTLWGKDKITERICGLSFEISPHSFFQVNTLQTEQLYRKAIEFAALSGKETVYDLYCGIGTISLSLAGYAKKVIGVESIPSAVSDAKRNAKANGIDNAQFCLGYAEDIVPELSKEFSADVVVLDPPRKGCDKKLLDTIISMAPKRIVYISCNVSTLARDIKLLEGYQAEKILPFDMFPRTPHVETVVLMSRVEK